MPVRKKVKKTKRYHDTRTGYPVSRKFAKDNPDLTTGITMHRAGVSLTDALNWAQLNHAISCVKQIVPDSTIIYPVTHNMVLQALLEWKEKLTPIIISKR